MEGQVDPASTRGECLEPIALLIFILSDTTGLRSITESLCSGRRGATSSTKAIDAIRTIAYSVLIGVIFIF